MDFPIVIVGSGFSGIAMAIQLLKAELHSFVILEKNDDIGGTWLENAYPGAACDVPSHLYSLSFEPNPDWSHAYSRQGEIHRYMQRVVEKYGLRRFIRFGTRVTAARFVEETGSWEIETQKGDRLTARALILGNGALNHPAYPAVEGLDSFRGPAFHSSRWRQDVDLTGKRVGVIGTGASAIQFVPELVPRVEKLFLFQRTPPWILPRKDRPYTPREKWAFRHIPGYRALYRAYIYWMHELTTLAFTRYPSWMLYGEWAGRRFLRASVPDEALRKKLLPRYTMGCKRVLLSNTYLPAIQQPNVEVVTDSIRRVTPTGIETCDGVRRDFDVLVYGTGFEVTRYLSLIDVRGRDGRRLGEVIEEKPDTLYGMALTGFPNLFLLVGPNTGLGSNSIIVMIEAQVRYVLQAIQHLQLERLRCLEVREPVQARLNQSLQARLQTTVWNSGCSSWYLHNGYNATIWPGLCTEYRQATWKFQPGDYDATRETA